ncbi:MAG: hypothetical protein QM776_05010 [Rhodocyclaceae bacterium]
MKPSDFYVGVLEFFAILLPGAIATAILAQPLSPLILGKIIAAPTSEAAGWGIFLVFAWFAGHLIFLAGAGIDRLYNAVRQRFHPYDQGCAFDCALSLRNSLIDESEQRALNTFQWSRSVLIATCPAAADDVHRLEADSKFFRSLMVVCLISAITFAAGRNFTEAAVALVLIAPCFARYYERRLKSITQAYLHVITLHRLGLLKKVEPDHE